MATCKAALVDAEHDLRRAQRRVEEAVKPILTGEADRIIAKAEVLQCEVDGKRAVLTFLEGLMEPGSPERGRVMMALPPPPPPGFPNPDYRRHSAQAAWQAAREALLHDSDAGLP